MPGNFNGLDVVSLRKFRRGYYMKVVKDAERALVRKAKARLKTPNIPKRMYWLRQNRVMRNIRRAAKTYNPNLFYDTAQNLFFFLMWCDKTVFEVMREPKKRKWAYIFDAWEQQWPHMEAEMKQWKNIGTVYFASSEAAEYFNSRLSFPVKWCAQAADCNEFVLAEESVGHKKRQIVLNIGRPNKVLINFFEVFCEKYDFQHICQDTTEGILFPSRKDFARTLVQSQIVVVHPRNLETPEITGQVSMLTARYFEAYNSGGVVCGFKPTSGEFDLVIQNYPFVEYKDDKSFENELLAALKNPEVWQKSKKMVRLEHTWDARAQDMIPDLPQIN